jgi:hypothetical protein
MHFTLSCFGPDAKREDIHFARKSRLSVPGVIDSLSNGGVLADGNRYRAMNDRDFNFAFCG